MVILGKTDDSAGAGSREYYTVLLKERVMADVMAVYDMEDGERLDTVYIMELEDGGTTYTFGSDGNSVGRVSDYGVSEKELIGFVLHHIDGNKKPQHRVYAKQGQGSENPAFNLLHIVKQGKTWTGIFGDGLCGDISRCILNKGDDTE